MIHQIVGASCLAACRPNHDPRPALDEIASLGFNAVRGPFAGALPWAGQELRHVYEGLPRFLGWCSERGLNAIVPYITEAGTGFNLEQHVTELEAIRRSFHKVVLPEVGNESPHPSQGGRLTPERCRDLAAMMVGPVSYGADLDDESTRYAGGDYVSIHLDRGRDHRWNMVRRVREMLAVSESTGKPVLSGEPIGADETEQPGKRCAAPEVFLTLGALNRLFLGGNGVFHSQAGLMAERLGPNQLACAKAYLAGVRVWPGAHRLQYKNTRFTEDTAPFKDADLRDEEPTRNGQPNPFYNPDGTVIRLYAGIEGDGRSGFAVGLGLLGTERDWKIETQHGWRLGEVLGEMPGVRVVRVVR